MGVGSIEQGELVVEARAHHMGPLLEDGKLCDQVKDPDTRARIIAELRKMRRQIKAGVPVKILTNEEDPMCYAGGCWEVSCDTADDPETVIAAERWANKHNLSK